eukprot:NODE_588_length_5657_cov_0.948183.p6 type:complete len:132 gc:universal NODE_588_length_5657_cov_0.948183:5053-4658(-)
MSKIISADASIGSNVTIGNNCIVHPTARISGPSPIIIGENNVISEYTIVQANIGNNNFIDSGACIYAPIGDQNYIGIQAIVDTPIYNLHTIRARENSHMVKPSMIHPIVDSIDKYINYCRVVMPRHIKLRQ